MLKEFAWKTFEYTGNIDNYIFLKEIENRNNVASQKSTAQAEAAFSLVLDYSL